MNLTKQEEIFLRNLRNNDIWMSILDKAEADQEIKPWKPGEKQNEDEKNAHWVYDSGRKRGVLDLLTIFRM